MLYHIFYLLDPKFKCKCMFPVLGQISYRNDQNYPYNNNIDFEPLDDENSPYPDSSSNELEKCSLEKNVNI